MSRIKTIIRNILVPSLTGGLGWVLIACSKEEAVVPDPEPGVQEPSAIAFNGNLTEEEVTRATTPLETYTKAFKVWGYKNMTEPTTGNYSGLQTVMDQYHVQWTANTAATTTTNSNDWEYILLTYPEQSIKYWDFGAKAYRFFGSAEMSATPGTWEHITEGTESYLYTCTADATSAVDAPFYTRLWFSTGDEDDYPTRQFGKPVTLEFIKPFAEVLFKFTLADPTISPKPMLDDPDFRPVNNSLRIAVTGGVQITFPLEGTATQESWVSTPDRSTKYLVAFTTPETPYTILPVRGQGAYILTVTVNGADKSCTVPAEYMNWSPGYRYTYIFKVNDEGGVELETVNIGIKNWEEIEPVDYNLYNW
jgi:hypothetical protein